MALKKITELTEDTAPASTDVTVTVDGLTVSKKVTWANVFAAFQSLITGLGTVTSGNVDAILPTASPTVSGISELATAAEINTGTDTGRTITPDAAAGSYLGTAAVGIVHTQSDTAVAVGDGTDGIPIPAKMNGMNITDVICTVDDKGVTGTTDVQVRRRRAGSEVDVLSTKVTLGDEFYANDGIINGSNDDLQTGDILYVDVDAIHSGTAPNGLSVVIEAGLP
jgi:hypothetical protein